MNTTAISVSRLRLLSRSRLTTRPADFVALMKPRVMLLAVFTAVVGLVIAPRHLDPLLGAVAIVAIAAGAGGAGALNMWYNADIDAMMTRTGPGVFQFLAAASHAEDFEGHPSQYGFVTARFQSRLDEKRGSRQ